MSSASLVRDKKSDIKVMGFRKVGKAMEYEFAFPLKNEDLGDALWEIGKAYQIAVLVGPSEKFNGVTDDTWMSDQVHIRIGSPSQESIYHPAYLAGQTGEASHGHSNGAKHEQKGKKR
jgi:hypothetical protein